MSARAVVLLAASVFTLGCSDGETAPPPGTTCQQIRLCVEQTPCLTDDCVQACAAKGTAAAQAAFQPLRACTAGVCAVDDVTCRCDEQCLAAGHCLDEVDACLAGLVADDICDNLCH